MILDKVRSYIDPADLEIHIYSDGVYIVNYSKISNFTGSKINILKDDKLISVIGSKLVISKLKKYEMFISGNINEVKL